MSTVLINAPASPVLGGGHLGRCLRLAEAFSLRGHEVVFLLADLGGGFPDRVLEAGFSLELSPWGGTATEVAYLGEAARRFQAGLLVVDRYDLSSAREAECCARLGRTALMVLDDCYVAHTCTVLLNHNLYAEEARYRREALVPPTTLVLAGPDYVLFPPDLPTYRRDHRSPCAAPKVLVSLGGSVQRDLLGRVLPLLHKLLPLDATLTLVAVPSSDEVPLLLLSRLQEEGRNVRLLPPQPSLLPLFHEADIAVTGGGVSAIEAVALGVPLLVVRLAENQALNTAYLDAKGLAVVVEHPEVDAHLERGCAELLGPAWSGLLPRLEALHLSPGGGAVVAAVEHCLGW